MTGVTVSDNHSTPTVTTSGTLSAVPGVYTITYTAKDEAGNIETKTRTITVSKSYNTDCALTTKTIGGKTVSSCFGTNDPSGNIRFIGSEPNNYVTFNNELWRIIGVFNGQIKIVRNNYYSAITSWDTSNSNNWSRPATVNTELNGTYWNTLNGTAQAMVDQSHSWGIGGISSGYTRIQFYNAENNKKWSGKVGLMTPADYGYASANSSCTDNLELYTTQICKNNNWIGRMPNYKWTITYDTSSSDYFWIINMDGRVSRWYAKTVDSIFVGYPVVYLKSNVEIISGDGTIESPYVLAQPITVSELVSKDNLQNLASLKRYRGANPNNWVCFGSSSITNPSSCDANHKWRIIGVDSTGRLKIMTNYNYGNKVFDRSGGTYGNNVWGRPADLKTELNGSSFYSNNAYIDTIHRGYIVNATWYTGAESPVETTTLQAFITGEKNKSTTGYVGLMSAVDYGYASINCTTSTNLYDTSTVCMNDNWIRNITNDQQWTITPYGSNDYRVWNVYGNGFLSTNSAYSTDINIRPVVYLDSSVKIIGGTGTSSSPYILTK